MPAVKSLNGKLCAGKLHARFEEGASAREEPRRKALLHRKKLPENHVVFAAVVVSLAMCATGATELADRWSFNGDYSDSVGGADAVKCGTYVSLYGGRVHMGYGACSLGAGDVTFTVTPMDCFGARGKSLATTFKA